jgi:thiol:disulfide interchange protein
MRFMRLGGVIILSVIVGACSNPPVSGPATVPSSARVTATAPATPKPTVTASTAPSASNKRSSAYLYDPTANARADVEAAFAAAKASGKRVLIDYGADWCPDCHSLAAFMDGSAGVALIDRSFEVVKVDVGTWNHNLDVSGQYGNAIANGIPAVVVYTADGKLIGSSADGSLANARAMTEDEVLRELAAWAK